MKNNNKILSLQGMRFFLFLLIFLNHIKHLIPYPIIDLGVIGVEFFFLLSGLLIGINYSNIKIEYSLKTSFEYYLKKMKQFYPIHLVSFLLILPVLLYQFITSKPNGDVILSFFHKILINLTLTQSWFNDEKYYFSFNGVSWFLSTILFLYFCTPFIISILNKFTPKKLIFTGFLLILFRIFIETAYFKLVGHDWGYFIYIFPIWRIFEYTIGCIFGIVYIKYLNNKLEKMKNRFLKLSIIEIIVFSIYIYLTLHLDQKWLTSYHTIFQLMLIIFITFGEGLISKILSFKLFVHLGNISTELYLFHFVLITWYNFIFIWSNSVHRPSHWFFECLIIFLASVVVSEIIYYLNNIYRSKRHREVNINA